MTKISLLFSQCIKFQGVVSEKPPTNFTNLTYPLLTQNKTEFPWIVGKGDQTSKRGGQDYAFSFVYQMDSRGQV